MKKIDLNTNIFEIDYGYINARFKNCLFHHFPIGKDFYTLVDLVTTSRGDLLKIRNMGKMTLMRVEDKLEEYGLKLGMTQKEVNEYQGEEIVSETEEKDKGVGSEDTDKQMLEVYATTINKAKEDAVNQCLTKKEWEDRVFRAALEIELELIRQGKEYSPIRTMEQDAALRAVKLMGQVRYELKAREEE